MKLAICLTATFLVVCSPAPLSASESATDCNTAVATFRAGLESQPHDSLVLFLDALQTNPGCRRDLLGEALEFSKKKPEQVEKMIFIARQEFPDDLTSFAEVALESVPEHAMVIREAFFADEDTMTAKLNPAAEDTGSALVTLPAEARELDSEIREAIARVTARVEGKLWPEQEVSGEPVAFRKPDEVRTSTTDQEVIEASLENAIPFDRMDERIADADPVILADEPSFELEKIHLDESKFTQGKADSREAREARKKEIAPAGQAVVPNRPRLARSRVYYIPPAKGDYRSTIDQDNQQRPPLVIRSMPASPTAPQ